MNRRRSEMRTIQAAALKERRERGEAVQKAKSWKRQRQYNATWANYHPLNRLDANRG